MVPCTSTTGRGCAADGRQLQLFAPGGDAPGNSSEMFSPSQNELATGYGMKGAACVECATTTPAAMSTTAAAAAVMALESFIGLLRLAGEYRYVEADVISDRGMLTPTDPLLTRNARPRVERND